MDPVDVALERLAPRWAGYWPGLDLVSEAASVRRRLDAAVRAWGLDEVRVIAGGNVALVAAARRSGDDGLVVETVVKVTPRGRMDTTMVAAEAEALERWRSTGAAVDLLDRRDGGGTVLLARLVPGTTLDASGVAGDERLQVLGTLAGRLHAVGRASDGGQTLEEYATPWRRALSGDAAAVDELDALVRPSADGADDVMLHGDLHGGNALLDGSAWRAIDPHGALGDRHADVWALIDPSVPLLPDDPGAARRTVRHRVAVYARAADLDADRVAAWARLRARAEALAIDAAASPSADDVAWAVRLRSTADALG